MPALLTRSRRWRTVVVTSASAVLLSLFGFAGWWWYGASLSATFSKDRVPRLARAGMLVAPGLYLIGSLSPSAVYVVETSEGLILVDSGLDRDAGLLKTEMGWGVPDTHFSIGDGIQAPDSDHEFVRKSGCLELPPNASRHRPQRPSRLVGPPWLHPM